MKLYDWHISYNYSSFIRAEFSDLDQLGACLVDSGLGSLCYTSDGTAIWNQEGKVCAQRVRPRAAKYASSATYGFPEGMSHAQMQYLHQAIMLRFEETKAFSEDLLRQVKYLRLFIEPYVFTSMPYRYSLYPILKMYDNGVVTVSFTVFSPESHCIETKDFIENYVNLYRKAISDLRMPSSIAKLELAEVFLTDSRSPISRARAWQKKDRIEAMIDRACLSEGWDDFERRFFDANILKDLLPESQTLIDLREQILFGVIASVTTSISKWRYIALGKPSVDLGFGGYWTGRPSVFLLKIEGSPKNTTRLRSLHRTDLGRILLRSPEVDAQTAKCALPESSRLHSDIGVYISEGLDLYVITESAKMNRLNPDPNGYDLTYPWLVKSEMIDHLNMTYRKGEELSRDHDVDLEEISSMKSRLSELNRILDFRLTSQYGEIRDLLSRASGVLQIATIREAIDSNISFRVSYIREESDRRLQVYGLVLALIFGLVGTTGLAQDIILPALQNGIDLERFPVAPEVRSMLRRWVSLISFGLAVSLLTCVALIAWQMLKRKRPSLMRTVRGS